MSTLEERFKSEFGALVLDPEPLNLQFTKLEAWIVFTNLQLALRHPANFGPSAEIARKIAKALEEALAVTPALHQVAAMGWLEDLSSEIPDGIERAAADSGT